MTIDIEKASSIYVAECGV